MRTSKIIKVIEKMHQKRDKLCKDYPISYNYAYARFHYGYRKALEDILKKIKKEKTNVK